MTLSKHELELAATFLRMAADEFSCHGCNDFRLPDSWTQQECDDFTLSMQAWNGDPENHEPGQRVIMDWFAMAYLAKKIEQQNQEKKQ